MIAKKLDKATQKVICTLVAIYTFHFLHFPYTVFTLFTFVTLFTLVQVIKNHPQNKIQFVFL